MKKYGKLFPREEASNIAKKDETVSALSSRSKSVIGRARQNNLERAQAEEAIFSQQDLDNAPMPTAL